MTDAPETEERKLSPACEVREVGPCKLQVRIEVGADKVKEEIDGKYKDLNETVELPGFRRGHAPRSLMERKFGKAVLEDLKYELINRSFDEVREEKKLEPMALPEVEAEKFSIEEGKPFQYEVEIEVRPNIDVKNYVGVKVSKPSYTAEEREIDEVLKDIQESKAELAPAEDGTAAEQDQVIADFELITGGKVIDRIENGSLFLNDRITFYGADMPEFYKSLLGRKVGETAEVTLTLPKDFHNEEFAGKEASLKVSIKSVKRKRLPPVDDEFAKSLDMDSVEELRSDIRKKIERRKEREARSKMAEDIVQELLRTNDFPIPEGVVAAGAAEALKRLHVRLAMEGLPEEKIRELLEKHKDASKEEMRSAFKAYFILEHIARKEKIFVTEDQLDERVGLLASMYGKPPHVMKAYLEEEGLLTQLRRTMREEMIKEFLLSKAVIVEGETSGGTGS